MKVRKSLRISLVSLDPYMEGLAPLQLATQSSTEHFKSFLSPTHPNRPRNLPHRLGTSICHDLCVKNKPDYFVEKKTPHTALPEISTLNRLLSSLLTRIGIIGNKGIANSIRDRGLW